MTVPASDEPARRLRLAVEDLAEADLVDVLAEARADARARVRAVLADIFAESMLEQVERRRAASAPQPAPASASRVDPRESDAGELAWYVYGVIAATGFEADPVPQGVDPSQAVQTLQERSLAVVCSQVAVDDFDDARLRANLADMTWIERVARSHEGVLEWTQQHTTVVPMRMCTVYRDEQGVRDMLRREAESLGGALAELEGRDEWAVKVLFDRSAVTKAPREESEAEASPDSGAQYMRRRQRELEQKEENAQALEAAAGRIHEQLIACAADALVAPAQRPEASGLAGEMVLNGVYLVDREAIDEFHELVRALQEEHREQGLTLVETGPWPAYNFVPGAIGAAW
jgi:hypothetical protein